MSQGRLVDPQSEDYMARCQPLGVPATEQACQNAPCSLSFWLLGAWGQCSTGQQTRPVTCVDARTRQPSIEVLARLYSSVRKFAL